MTTPIVMDGITFDPADFLNNNGYGYQTTVTVRGVPYWRQHAMFVAGLNEIGARVSAAAGAIPSIDYTFDGGTTDADPGAGRLRLNNATQSSATAIYLDNASAAGVTVTGILDAWDDSTSTVKGTLRLAHRTDATKWLEFRVTGAVVDGTGYRKLTVAHVGGSAASPFAASDPVAVGFVRAGDAGSQGPPAGQDVSPTASPTFAGLTISSGSPVIGLRDSNGTTDNQQADFFYDAAVLYARFPNDAYGTAVSWLTVARSGQTVTGITFGGPLTVGRLHGSTTSGRQVSVGGGSNGWIDISSNGGGVALVGNNLHTDQTANTFHTSLTHGSLGYAALRLAAGAIHFAGVSGATTADAAVTPTWHAVWHAGNAPGPLTNANGAWWSTADGAGRFFFAASGTTFIRGHGTNPLEFRTGADATVASINEFGTFSVGQARTSQFPAANLLAAETGHATSRRASIQIGNHWSWMSDTAGNGTRDFSLYNANLAQHLITISAAGVVNFAQTPTVEANPVISGGRHTLAFHAASLTPRTTGGPGSYSVQGGTNGTVVRGLAFDPATTEYAQVGFPMPKSWNRGALRVQFIWTAAGNTGQAVWAARGWAGVTTGATDPAWGTAQTITSTVGSANTRVDTSETADITLAGSTGGTTWVQLEVYRDATNVADTMAADAILLGIRVFYVVNATNDA